jgi:hypothetical protein
VRAAAGNGAPALLSFPAVTDPLPKSSPKVFLGTAKYPKYAEGGFFAYFGYFAVCSLIPLPNIPLPPPANPEDKMAEK